VARDSGTSAGAPENGSPFTLAFGTTSRDLSSPSMEAKQLAHNDIPEPDLVCLSVLVAIASLNICTKIPSDHEASYAESYFSNEGTSATCPKIRYRFEYRTFGDISLVYSKDSTQGNGTGKQKSVTKDQCSTSWTSTIQQKPRTRRRTNELQARSMIQLIRTLPLL
jgi:hypothetical protein